jgi:hypothetical protein
MEHEIIIRVNWEGDPKAGRDVAAEVMDQMMERLLETDGVVDPGIGATLHADGLSWIDA